MGLPASLGRLIPPGADIGILLLENMIKVSGDLPAFEIAHGDCFAAVPFVREDMSDFGRVELRIHCQASMKPAA